MLAELALIVSKAVVIYVQLFLIATVSISNHVVVGNQKEFGSKHRVAPSHHGRNHVELLAWAIKLNIPYDHKSGYENMKNQLDKIAEKTAKDSYLINKGQIGGLLGHYLFVHFLHNESSFLSDSNYFTQNLGSSKQKGSTFLRYISKGANISISEDNFYTMKDTVHSSMDSHDDIEWYSQQIVRPRKKREANLIQSSSSTIHSLLSKNIKYRKPSLSQTNGGFVIQKKQGVSQSHNGTEKHANSSKKELVLSSDVNSSEVHSLRRMKRQTTGTLDFQDPIYPYQWHLHNYGNIISDMFNPGLRMDINITGVWERGITGKGVTVCVIDDGLQWSSLDLVDNYSPEGSWDLNGNDKDPMPDPSKGKNHHGTRCAGEIAAAANTYCAVGVAFQSKIAGIRMLDGPMTDSMEAAAFTMGMNINDVYSCSWGPKDDGKTVDGPHYLAQIAMQQGVNYGRHGYGSIYVVASGNGGRFKDNCNFDGYANSLYTVTIGAVDDTGNMPYYAEECASMLAVTFSSGDGLHRSIYTTDWTLDGSSGCTGGHTGTSAAAPLAAGMIALALQARPCLTWRDIQYLIVLTAVKVDRDLGHWHKNQAGLSHSHRHGFGLMSAWRLVNAAKAWEPIPWMTIYTTGDMTDNAVIPRKPGRLEVDFTVTAEVLDGYWLQLLEHVQVTLTIEHPRRGDLDIRLMCPSGTISYLATPRSMDTSSEGFNGWAFSTVRCWGEEPYGNWTLTIQDKGQSGPGTLVKWQLKLIGVPLSSEDFRDRLRYVERATSGQYLSDNYSLPCPAAPVQTELVVPVTYKTLKIICLTSLFCLVLGFYETFEYAFCYDDEKKEHSHRMRLALQAQQLARENSNTSTSSNQDATETTRLIPSESIPMRTFNRTTSSEGASGGDGMGNGAIGDGDLGDGAAGEKEELLKHLHSPDIPEEILETLSPDEIRLNMSLGDKLREKVKKNRVKKHSSPEKSSVHDAGAYASIR